MWKCNVVIPIALFINLLLLVRPTRARREFKIGGIFSNARASESQQLAFKIAVDLVNPTGQNTPPFVLTSVTSEADTNNILKTSWETCQLMAEGILGLIGPNSQKSSPYIQSICDSKEMPQIETRWYHQYQRRNGSINVHPHPPTVQEIYTDLIRAWGWNRYTVIYEDDDDLKRIENLLASNREIVTLRQIKFDQNGSCRAMLNAIKRTGEEHFVLICAIDVLEEVLKQAQQVGLVTEKQHYIIYNLDMHMANLEPYQYGGSNITGIRFFDPDDPEVLSIAHSISAQQMKRALPPPMLTTEMALTIDAVRVFYSILEDLYLSKHPPERPLFCDSPDTRHHGYSIINDMMMKIIPGITGSLKFDAEGFRTDLKADVLELGVTGLNKVGTWITQGGLQIQRALETGDPEVGESIKRQSFIVIIALTNPYAMVKQTTHQLYGNDRFEGFGIDLIHELSLILGFNYTFTVQEDGSNGKYNRLTKQWDGMIGEVVDGRAHLAITDLTITAEREQAVDFTLPFMNLGISILYKKPEPVPPSLFMFLSPFSGQVWMLLGGAYFVVSVSLFIMARLCPSEWTNPYPCIEEPEFLINQFSLRNSLWFTIGSLMQQGTEIAPTGISTRMVAGAWWFFTLIMVSSYTANLAAFLTVETLVTPFKDIDELAKQTEIAYGAKADGATAYFFRDTEKETYQKVWHYMKRHPEMMTLDNDEGVRRVKEERYAFLMESTTIEYVIERHCTLAQVGGLLVEKGYGIAMRKGSKYRAELNAAILKLQETGELTNLKIKWWKEKRGGGNCASRAAGAAAQSLNLQNVGGVFLVLGVGSILAFLATFIELALHTMKRSYHHDEVDFKKEMKDELRFFVKFRGMNKPQK